MGDIRVIGVTTSQLDTLRTVRWFDQNQFGATSRQIARKTGLPVLVTQEILRRLLQRELVVFSASRVHSYWYTSAAGKELLTKMDGG